MKTAEEMRQLAQRSIEEIKMNGLQAIEIAILMAAGNGKCQVVVQIYKEYQEEFRAHFESHGYTFKNSGFGGIVIGWCSLVGESPQQPPKSSSGFL